MNKTSLRYRLFAVWILLPLATAGPSPAAELPQAFLVRHCQECHNGELQEGGLNLAALKLELAGSENFARWVKIYERIASGEMPPKKQPRPPVAEQLAVTQWLKTALLSAEQRQLQAEPHTGLRRLTRAEYENTIRDLFDLPGILLQLDLPADGSAYGFDKNSDALHISRINLAKYLDAADRVLDMAIATQPAPPVVKKQRISLANERSVLAICVLEGDVVMLKDKKPDPNYLPAGKQKHINYTAHLAYGMHADVSPGASVGVFRQQGSEFNPSFAEFVAIYPAHYRIRTAFWSFLWDKGQVLPSPRTQTARMDVWHMTGHGNGLGHPNTLLGYFDAPSLNEQKYDIRRWFNPGETLGVNFVESEVVFQARLAKGRLSGWTGPGLACDGLEIEGPLYDQWPPASHQLLFGDLPLAEFKPEEHPGVRPPKHPRYEQRLSGRNYPDPHPSTLKLHTVHSQNPLADADRLLAGFLPKAFRRPVSPEVRQTYVALVGAQLKAGDTFEVAMRQAYRAALCSPDFLYHLEYGPTSSPAESAGQQQPNLDGYSLASRLSYFFWNSMPDEKLVELAAAGLLHQPAVLQAQVERLLQDPKSERFREDFLGQWLKLRQIAATDPDPKLYGEFKVDLQDAMVGETRSYFQELLDKDLGAEYLVKSDFAMLNERLARHYGISGVTGSQFRRVALPAGSPRGPFLTQASILKVTANGTTTSPVPRGAFVMDRLLGQPPEPPPANVAAVEPDVRGATTIREQLAKHRDNATCATCHAKIDPPGFALESFDVIGGQRDRYRTISDIKPLVDPAGTLADGRTFRDIAEFQALIAADSSRLLRNMAEKLAIYGTGRGLTFSDRDQIAAIVASTQQQGGGIRTLLHKLVESSLFQTR